MKSNYLLIYILLLSSAFGFAQNYNISGTVKEKGSGLPLPGVSIQVKNSTKVTISDLDGNFSLKDVSSGAIVSFSYVGFQTYDYKVTGADNAIIISLIEDTKSLDEVIVIGYGTQKKKDITGSVSVIDSKTIEQIKPVRADQALQGTASGVIVTATSGAPGAQFDIKIRGVSSNLVNRPTAIIDGYVGNLTDLNPADIETMTVLKDAQAAIYGVIAANGIIIVTTKQGKKGMKTKVTYNGYTGFQETSNKLNLLNATEYGLLLNESYANGGKALPYPNASGLGIGTDWQNQLFRKNAPVISHDFSIAGGTEKVTYSISASDLNQEGIIGEWDKAGFKRNTARISLGVDFSEKLKFKTNLIYTFLKSRDFNQNGLGSVLFNAINTPATFSPYDANGDYTLIPGNLGIEIINPLAQLENTYNIGIYRKLNGNFSLDYEAIKGLVLTARVGFNSGNGESKNFAKMVSYQYDKVFNVPRSRVDEGRTIDNNYSVDLFLDYKKSFNNHNLELTLGNTIFKEWGSGVFASGYDVPNNSWEFADLQDAIGTSDARDASGFTYDERRLSYFARLQYNYNEKYLFSAMARRDASTKFGPNNTIAYFLSGTAGWVVSKENFYGENNLIDFLKLRGSYGVLGNDQIGNNGYVGSLSGEGVYVFNNGLTYGTAVGILPNPDLKWEKGKKLDLGLDMNLFNDHIAITTDYYFDKREDLLIGGLPISGITGIGAPGSGPPTVNAGSTKNTGVEFAINYNNRKAAGDFKVDINYNITTIKNTVTDVNSEAGYLQGGSFGVGQSLLPSRMEIGKPIGYFYGYQMEGIFQNQAEIDAHAPQTGIGSAATMPGDIKFKDVNGDGVVDTDDRTDLGNPIPAMTMGFNFTLNYKNIDLAAYTYASIGNEAVRNYERVLSDANKLDYVLDRWTGDGTSNSVPRVTTDATNNNLFSSYFVEDASYFKIQNVQLGYTLNPKITSRAGISKLRLYASVNNVYTFTKYKGFDPSVISAAPIGGGIDNGSYPMPRTYMMGININF